MADAMATTMRAASCEQLRCIKHGNGKRRKRHMRLSVTAQTRVREQTTEREPPSTPPTPPSGGPPGSPPRGNEPPWKGVSKALLAGVFVAGIGAGVAFDSVVSLEPNNVASREVIDRNSPNSELCAMNGASAMVFDQRIFLSFNPFNVYVTQPEVKPGCVLRRSNWSVLERRNLVSKDQVESCKRGMNTFAFVGDLQSDPKVSCVYHSEQAENQFMQDPNYAAFSSSPKPFQ